MSAGPQLSEGDGKGLTVKYKVIERVIVMVREQDIILDCSAHNPAYMVSECVDARLSRWLTKGSVVHRQWFHTL